MAGRVRCGRSTPVAEPSFTDLNAYFEKWGPGPLEPARRRAAIADCVALLVKHRALLAFLAKEGDRRDHEPVMRQWPRGAKQFAQLTYGNEEDLSERLYLAAAIRGGLALAPVGFPEVADDELREHLQVAAERLLARPRRRTA
jgi:hypothetical protein